MASPKIDSDELVATTTEGYKVGEKKTIEELQALDAEDESLVRWKQSLGLGTGAAAAASDDPRKVIVLSLAMEVAGRSDVVLDLTQTDLKNKNLNISIKEGIEYCLKIKFKIQHEVVSGLKYLHAVKRMGVTLEKRQEMLGSYGPNAEAYEKKFGLEEAPSGMLQRGSYSIKSKFVDDDNVAHLEWDWILEIKKDW
ncbi:E set domain-containing protein [Conidiobolus coronatus NRRL 28638]|uniref:Rho GDP-dissociation inhibitor n=1 Tax=Conidiobolus coronatus (strain ATCC 28846 / CBS 209.66 / NRRL 28638) TaxID=796925 RepID=A0A137NZZ7_CONC2|nr:E set domain-containing protein [Conidiobolus coronatus NRRL 28638]|eukprot:KXN68312.1 E set domain-containing protein [Conidiobolus coronatus NRRL 28638]